MALENVLCARAWSSEQQCELLVDLAVKCVPGAGVTESDPRFVEDRTYKLLIVDSIMNLFRQSVWPSRCCIDTVGQDYSGRGELSERQQVSSLVCRF